MKSRTRVVHVSRSLYDVYIGRGPDPKTGVVGKWGNPFKIGVDGTRSEVIRKYKEWVMTQPHLVASLKELRGLRLGCWCVPKFCHGHALAELADAAEQDQKAPVAEKDEKSIFD